MLGQFAKHKTPGLDSITIELYLPHKDEVLPRLLSFYSFILKEKMLPNSLNEALVVLIPKPHNDPTFCESYHPIFLINTDLKILSKLLAIWLNTVSTQLVHSDKTGFIPGHSTYCIRIYKFLMTQIPLGCLWPWTSTSHLTL